jgi:hypothetical protein
MISFFKTLWRRYQLRRTLKKINKEDPFIY